MINKILLIVIILMCCNCSSGWDTEAGREYKFAFMNECTNGDYTKNTSCLCVLNKLTAKYSGPFDNVAGQIKDAIKFGMECY